MTTVTQPAPSPGAPRPAHGYQYDSAGRRTEETLPDFSKTWSQYYTTGDLKKTWGANTYTQEYEYDSAGRRTRMVTAAGATRWVYDPLTGFLIRKEFVTGQPTEYTHTNAGRLQTSRSTGGELITYGYNNAGDLASVDYQSDSSPDVSVTYNRRGLRSTVGDGAGPTCWLPPEIPFPDPTTKRAALIAEGFDDASCDQLCNATYTGWPPLSQSPANRPPGNRTLSRPLPPLTRAHKPKLTSADPGASLANESED